jgi:hypothetical protein
MSKVNVGALIKELSGQEPTPADVNRIEAIAHRMGIDRDDPYMPMLAVLEWYHGAYSRLPAEVAQGCTAAAKNAADTASTLAQTNMNNAVAQLVPSVEHAVEKAARTAVQRIKIGTSLFTIWFGMCSLGLMFGVGWLAGAHIFAALHDKDITVENFWQYTGWGIGIGITSPGLLIFGVTDYLNSSEKITAFQVLMTGLGVCGILILFLRVLGILH